MIPYETKQKKPIRRVPTDAGQTKKYNTNNITSVSQQRIKSLPQRQLSHHPEGHSYTQAVISVNLVFDILA